jgi:cobyrinic acid a,c-diamide synthase
MGLIIAGERSGIGKTTVTLAILAYLSRFLGDRVQSFKVGPDYIDPMFHSAITHRPCRNLDPVLTSSSYVRYCFDRHTRDVDWVIIEGVMGLFDGISHKMFNNEGFLPDYASTAHIARILNLPVLLVLDCSRLSGSIAAITWGYAQIDPQVKIAGVVLNRVASDRHLELLQTALDSIEMPVLGVLRRYEEINIPDRHLGLIPTAELPQLPEIYNRLADLAKTSFNWKKIFPLLANNQSPIAQASISPSGSPISTGETPKTALAHNSQPPVKIAVARDRAFNFYYQDNLDILSELGTEIVFWSPLVDRTIPENVRGLYFGGGFPEVFAEQLAENRDLLRQLQQVINAGIPTYAECGGLMYLCDRLTDLTGKTRSMVGIIPATAIMTSKLTLGYRQATSLQNSSLIPQGKTVRGHEFHRSQLSNDSATPLWQVQGFAATSPIKQEGCQFGQVYASYLHLHFGEYRFVAENFVRCCRNYQS